ncbi:hypothetical protein TcYC6_0083960 [Trypanosoma cruzi]|nr:hypothetical protein TcYC6_0083960 [Trypanosoma cruzi]
MSARRCFCVLQPSSQYGGAFVESRRFTSTILQERLRRLAAIRSTENVVVEEKNELERSLPREVEEMHQKAHDAGKDKYVDPNTGQIVLTRHFHIKRGICCGNRCRHCPYNHVNVLAAAARAPPKRKID